MKSITVSRATGSEPAVILIQDEIGEVAARGDPEWMRRYEAFYAVQAHAIADTLLESLPGGTVDRLLAELLTRRASLLRVPFITPRARRTHKDAP